MNCVLAVLTWKEKCPHRWFPSLQTALILAQHKVCSKSWLYQNREAFVFLHLCPQLPSSHGHSHGNSYQLWTSLSTASIFRCSNGHTYQLLVLPLTLTVWSLIPSVCPKSFTLKQEVTSNGIQSPHLGCQDGCLTGHTYQLSTAGSQHIHTPTVWWSD